MPKKPTISETPTSETSQDAVLDEFSAAFPPWLLPNEQRGDLVGRESLVDDLERKLFASGTLGRVALTGLGGIGKSRMAMEIAYRTKQKRPSCSIFWIQATDLQSVQRGYSDIAKALHLSTARDSPLQTLAVVRERLSQEEMGEWLLIVDDADDNNLWVRRTPGDSNSQPRLMDYVPQNAKGAVLITTRCRQVAVRIAHKCIIPLDTLGIDDAVQLFNSRLIYPIFEEPETIVELARFLTCLPLALIRAADFINEHDFSISMLLQLLQENGEAVMGLLGTDSDRVEQSTSTSPLIRKTWLLSIEQIQQQDECALAMLTFVSCVNHKNIPFSMIPLTQTSFHKMRAISLLTSYGLLQKYEGEGNGQCFEIHWLVYLAIRSWLRQTQTFYESSKQAISHMMELLNGISKENTVDILASYLPHIEHLYDAPEVANIEDRLIMLGLTGYLLYTHGEHERSLSYLQQAVRDAEARPKPSSSMTYCCFGWFAHVLSMQGSLSKAESYLKKALISMSQLSHPENTVNWVTVTDDLIKVCLRLTWNEEAERLAKQMVDHNIKHFGENNPATLAAVSLWGDFYLTKDCRFCADEQKLLQLIEVCSRTLGDNHVHTGHAKRQLAHLYLESSKVANAQELLLSAVKAFKECLSNDDSRGTWIRMGLVMVYVMQSKMKRAESMLDELQNLDGLLAYEEKFWQVALALYYSGRRSDRQAFHWALRFLESSSSPHVRAIVLPILEQTAGRIAKCADCRDAEYLLENIREVAVFYKFTTSVLKDVFSGYFEKGRYEEAEAFLGRQWLFAVGSSSGRHLPRNEIQELQRYGYDRLEPWKVEQERLRREFEKKYEQRREQQREQQRLKYLEELNKRKRNSLVERIRAVVTGVKNSPPR